MGDPPSAPPHRRLYLLERPRLLSEGLPAAASRSAIHGTPTASTRIAPASHSLKAGHTQTRVQEHHRSYAPLRRWTSPEPSTEQTTCDCVRGLLAHRLPPQPPHRLSLHLDRRRYGLLRRNDRPRRPTDALPIPVGRFASQV